jgi:hypothetical protein
VHWKILFIKFGHLLINWYGVCKKLSLLKFECWDFCFCSCWKHRIHLQSTMFIICILWHFHIIHKCVAMIAGLSSVRTWTFGREQWPPKHSWFLGIKAFMWKPVNVNCLGNNSLLCKWDHSIQGHDPCPYRRRFCLRGCGGLCGDGVGSA